MRQPPRLFVLALGAAGFGACALSTHGLGTGSSTSTGGGATTTFASTGGVTTTSVSSGGGMGPGGGSVSSSAASSSSTAASSSASSSSGVAATCDIQFGSASGYQLCAIERGDCEFNFNVNHATSCGSLCGELGGECVSTLDNGMPCEYLTAVKDCSFTGYGNAICRCKLGCGNGPPCPASHTCSGGQCQ